MVEPHLGAARRPRRRPVPRRPRHLDGGRRPPVDRRGPRHDAVGPAMDRLRVRPRLRRAAPARRPLGRPARSPVGVPVRRRRVRHRLGRQRVPQQRPGADRPALRQGRRGGVHRAGRPVDHHDDVRRGPGPQPCPQHLHGLRRERLLDGPRLRRCAHRARLAHDVPAAWPGGSAAAVRRPQGRPALGAPGLVAQALRPARRVHQHGFAADPGLRRRRGADPRLDQSRHLGLPGRQCPAGGAVRRGRAPARPPARTPGDPALGQRGARQPGGCGDVRCVRVVPVRRDALPAERARLVAAGDGARASCRPASWSSRASSRWARCSSGSTRVW